MNKRNKVKKKKNKFCKFIFLVLLLLSAFFMGMLYYLDILPLKYFALAVCGAVFIVGLFGIVLLNTRVKKIIRFFITLLSLILIACIILASKYLIDFKSLFNNFSASIDYKTENYSVVVLNDSSYDEIQDLENEDLGYLDNATQGTTKALKKVQKKVKIQLDDYDDLAQLSQDLLEEDIDAILIEDSFKEILEESDDEFQNNTKVIYSFSVKVNEEKNSKQVDVTSQSFNVYISGIDTYGKISSVSRSDVNIVATINPNTHTILLTDIPRDYYVPLQDKKGYSDKLTHAGIYGVGTSVGTIEDLLDININYYVKVNFTSVVTLVDALDGVTVHSDYTFISDDNYKYYVGDNYVNGAKALSFVRERHSFDDGDIQRGKNQMYMIEAIANELMSFKSITKFEDILDVMDGAFETNLSTDEITSLIKMQINQMIEWNIDTNSLEGEGSYEYTYTYQSQKLYVLVPNETSVASAKTKISKVMNE